MILEFETLEFKIQIFEKRIPIQRFSLDIFEAGSY